MSVEGRVVACAAVVATMLLAACGGSGGDSETSTAQPTRAAIVTPTVDARPTEDAQAAATRVAESPAAKLGPTLLNPSDYPADLLVQQEQSRFVHPADVPGVESEASGYFVTLAPASGDEFVSLVVLVFADSTAPAGALDALTPEMYLAGLTSSASDAASTPLDLSTAPAGANGFNYSATVPGRAARPLTGQILGFVRGDAYVLLTHGMYAPSTRNIDIAAIASAISGRLGTGGAAN